MSLRPRQPGGDFGAFIRGVKHSEKGAMPEEVKSLSAAEFNKLANAALAYFEREGRRRRVAKKRPRSEDQPPPPPFHPQAPSPLVEEASPPSAAAEELSPPPEEEASSPLTAAAAEDPSSPPAPLSPPSEDEEEEISDPVERERQEWDDFREEFEGLSYAQAIGRHPLLYLQDFQVPLVLAFQRYNIFELDSEGHYVFNRDNFDNCMRSAPDNNPIKKFVRYLRRETGSEKTTCTIMPNYQDILRIPISDVYNLSGSLLLYIILRLKEKQEEFSRNEIGKKCTLFSDLRNTYFFRRPGGHRDALLNLEKITLDDILIIFNHIYSRIRTAFGQDFRSRDARDISWTDPHQRTAESGDRILIRHIYREGQTHFFYLKMFFVDGWQTRLAFCWCPEVKEAMHQWLEGTGCVTVANFDDKCIFYCLVLALIYDIAKKQGKPVTKFDKSVLEISEVWMLVNQMRVYGEDLPKVIIDKCSDPQNDLDAYISKTFSLREFVEVMKVIEDEFLPDETEYAIDVYFINATKSNRVYPGYMSKRLCNTRLNLLFLITKTISHAFWIRNLPLLFKKTQGKIFTVCSTCKQAFFTKSLECNHQCVNGNKSEYHLSALHETVQDIQGLDLPKCERCFLLFKNQWKYEYHLMHCLMAKHSGYRHVKLLPESRNHLTYVDPADDDSLGKTKLMFADFESYLKPSEEDPSIQEHHFLSYGLLSGLEDTEDDPLRFSLGYDIEGFMTKLDKISMKYKKTVVYFHNAMNYDVFFIIKYYLDHHKERKDIWNKWSMRILMKNSTSLQSVSFMCNDPDQKGHKHQLIIGDTCKFLTMSLDRIVSSLRTESLEKNMEVFPLFFKLIKRKYQYVSNEDIDLILHKNLFPYSFFDDPEKLNVDIDEFAAIFVDSEDNLKYFSAGTTLDDLKTNLPQFISICDKFKIHGSRGYHDLYLMCDVLQIADVFLKARLSLKESHHIDLTQYIGMPAASWAAFLRSNPELDLQLYTDTFFAEFFQSMTRGGVTSAPIRSAKSDDTHSIIYLDVNGLYPHVMQKYPYPMGDFTLYHYHDEEDSQVDLTLLVMEMIKNFKTAGDKGACFCVDLQIPDMIKEDTDEYPFAPEHKLIKDEYFDKDGNLYGFMAKWSEKNNGHMPSAFKGLVGTLYDKKSYGVHWRLLEFYLNHGVVITKLHFYVTFTEGFYMQEYIRKNIDIRNTRKDALGKMVYKLLGNSIYGKTFESPFNHGNYVLINNHEKLAGLIEEGNVGSIVPIDEENSIVKIEGEEVILDKPTYIGACVTEHAKLHMYELFYDKLKPMFGKDNVHLVYTDTDSFIVLIEHPKGMKVIEELKNREINGEVLIGSEGGKIKSETGDEIIQECIALRSKVYAYMLPDGHIGKRAKGTTAAAQDLQLDWDTYKRALIELKGIPTTNMQFIRDRFTVRTGEVEKLSLSANDGKRYICEDGIHTLAWGNPKIPH